MRVSVQATVILGAGIAAIPFACAATSGNIVTDIADEYDFVIVGGGQAGLVLGSRLSEDSNHTVLVLESGDNGDEYRKRIDTPAYAYFDSLWTTPLNWNFKTVAQSNVDNRQITWPRGKVLGGCSAINGLYLTRPGEIEISAWRDMLGDMDGADLWSWDSFYAALKRSEAFTPPIDSVVDKAAITWDVASHGSKGPIHATYPGYTFPEVGQWIKSLANVGIAAARDAYGGQNWGAVVSSSSINPSNWTRSYSRTGYLDNIPGRVNYDVMANAHVTRIIFNTSSPDNLNADAVEFTRDNGTTRETVRVRKEVILASGTVGSPAVLLHSGIGPKDVLDKAGVKVVSELPGVGQHLQDHLSATVKWTTDQPTAGTIFYENGTDKDNTLYLSYIDSAIAYVNSTRLYGDSVKQLQQNIISQRDQHTPSSSSDRTVIAGFKAIYDMTVSKIFSSPLGQIELLFMNSDANGDIGITAAIQHPYSHGSISISSSNPMDPPVIDPNYLSHPFDLQLLREGLKLARQVGQSNPLKSSLTAEVSPGLTTQSDQDWEVWLRNNSGTEFHPSSSCAMLPRDQGGVVDANLRVYGLANVRVADASIPPISFSSHLMGSTYGIAELASEIIRNSHRDVPSFPIATASDDGGSSSSKNSEGQKNDGMSWRRQAWQHAMVQFFVLAILSMTQTLI